MAKYLVVVFACLAFCCNVSVAQPPPGGDPVAWGCSFNSPCHTSVKKFHDDTSVPLERDYEYVEIEVDFSFGIPKFEQGKVVLYLVEGTTETEIWDTTNISGEYENLSRKVKIRASGIYEDVTSGGTPLIPFGDGEWKFRVRLTDSNDACNYYEDDCDADDGEMSGSGWDLTLETDGVVSNNVAPFLVVVDEVKSGEWSYDVPEGKSGVITFEYKNTDDTTWIDVSTVVFVSGSGTLDANFWTMLYAPAGDFFDDYDVVGYLWDLDDWDFDNDEPESMAVYQDIDQGIFGD